MFEVSINYIAACAFITVAYAIYRTFDVAHIAALLEVKEEQAALIIRQQCVINALALVAFGVATVAVTIWFELNNTLMMAAILAPMVFDLFIKFSDYSQRNVKSIRKMGTIYSVIFTLMSIVAAHAA